MALSGNTFAVCVLQFISTSLGMYDDSYYYEISGDDYSDKPPSSDCRYDSECSTGYCCRESMTCCDAPYGGVIIKCKNTGIYTGLECPPTYDPSRVFCCYAGRRCCSSNIGTPYSRPGGGKNSVEQSGVTSMGAIAGFVFLAVIIIGTLLTLATRYIKIKVRREHRRAGIQSQAYLDAINRRINGPELGQNHDQNPSGDYDANVPTQNPAQQPSGIFFIHVNQQEQNEEEDEAGLPPSYDEAMATCPVVDEGTRSSPENGRRNFPFRPPMRPNREQQANVESIPLSVRKGNYDPIQLNSATAERADTAFETLPKEDDSQA